MPRKYLLKFLLAVILVAFLAAGWLYYDYYQRNTYQDRNYNKNHPAVTIYLNDDVNIGQVNTLLENLKSTKGLIMVQYLTKEEAFGEYKKGIQNIPPEEIQLTDDEVKQSLSPKVNVYLKSSASTDSIKQLVENKSFIKNVVYNPRPPKSN
ncbi:hypothetical protein HYW46_02970 [Candidatus Daviesbacteria bacterium]|nr:hypothetical protein [Candidatus Daviesbacteria bacterium]